MVHLVKYLETAVSGANKDAAGAILSEVANTLAEAAITRAKTDLYAQIESELDPVLLEYKKDALRTGDFSELGEQINTTTKEFLGDYRKSHPDILSANAFNQLEGEVIRGVAKNTVAFVETQVKDMQRIAVMESLQNSLKAVYQDPGSIDSHLKRAASLEPDLAVALESTAKAKEKIAEIKSQLVLYSIASAAASSVESAVAILATFQDEITVVDKEKARKAIKSYAEEKLNENKRQVEIEEGIDAVFDALSGSLENQEFHLMPSDPKSQKAMDDWYFAYKSGRLADDPRARNTDTADVINATSILPKDYVTDMYKKMHSDEPLIVAEAAKEVQKVKTISPYLLSNNKVLSDEIIGDVTEVYNALSAGISPKGAHRALQERRGITDVKRGFLREHLGRIAGNITTRVSDLASNVYNKKAGIPDLNDVATLDNGSSIALRPEKGKYLIPPPNAIVEAELMTHEYYAQHGLEENDAADAGVAASQRIWQRGHFLGRERVQKGAISSYFRGAPLALVPDTEEFASMNTMTTLQTPGEEKNPKVTAYYEIDFARDYASQNFLNHTQKPSDLKGIEIEYYGELPTPEGSKPFWTIYVTDEDGVTKSLIVDESDGISTAYLWTPSSVEEFAKENPDIKIIKNGE